MTKIKLCGLRRSDDIDYANALLPEYVGFVFSQKSSRYVTPQEACLLRQQLDERITSVGVFVDESPEVIANLLEQGIIGVAQLHGQETEETIRMLQQRTGRAVMKAFCIRDAAAALMNMECVVFMGEEDTRRQALNVYRMRLLGAEVIPVTSGTATLKDAVSEAMREWTSRIDDTHYCLGSVMGPHPFPTIVRDFQSVISREIKDEILEKEHRLPDAVIACVGGGSNAIGSFYHFIDDDQVRLIGCEAAGLDYPGIGPEHAYLHDIGCAEYVPVTDDEAVEAFEFLSRTEGIIPAIESAHAVAYAMKLAPTLTREQVIVITISGRGDKDCAAIARYRGEDIHE